MEQLGLDRFEQNQLNVLIQEELIDQAKSNVNMRLLMLQPNKLQELWEDNRNGKILNL